MEFPHDSGVQITYLPRRGMGVLGKPEPGSATGPTQQEDWENAPGRKLSTPSLQRKTKTMRNSLMNKSAGLIGLVTSRFEIDDATLEKWASWMPGGSPLKRVPLPAPKAPVAKAPRKPLKPPKGSESARASAAKASVSTPEAAPPTGTPAPTPGAPMPGPVPAPAVTPPPAPVPAAGGSAAPVPKPDLAPIAQKAVEEGKVPKKKVRGTGLKQPGPDYVTREQAAQHGEIRGMDPAAVLQMGQQQGMPVSPWQKIMANPWANMAAQIGAPMVVDPILRRAFGDDSVIPTVGSFGAMMAAGPMMQRYSGAAAMQNQLAQRALRGRLQPAPAPTA